MDQPVHKLQVCKSVLIELALSKKQKVYQIKCLKSFHIWKWMSLAISTFAILEEMASEQQNSSKQKHF